MQKCETLPIVMEQQELTERITELEAQLAQALARITVLERTPQRSPPKAKAVTANSGDAIDKVYELHLATTHKATNKYVGELTMYIPHELTTEPQCMVTVSSEAGAHVFTLDKQAKGSGNNKYVSTGSWAGPIYLPVTASTIYISVD